MSSSQGDDGRPTDAALTREALTREVLTREVLTREVTLAVRHLQRAGEEARLALARRLNLGATDLSAMDHLIADEPLGPVELGNRLGIRSASATVLADRLEKSGHVVRIPHPTDRRRQTLQPTEHARTEVLRALSPMLSGLQALADAFTTQEAEVILRFLNDATDVLTDYAIGQPIAATEKPIAAGEEPIAGADEQARHADQ